MEMMELKPQNLDLDFAQANWTPLVSKLTTVDCKSGVFREQERDKYLNQALRYIAEAKQRSKELHEHDEGL